MDEYGVSVIAKKSTPLIIKISWLIILLLSLFGLGYYIRESYIKWEITPEIAINEKIIPSRDIPFPAITICSPLVVKKEFLDLSKYFKNSLQHMTVVPKTNKSERKVISAYLNACYDNLLLGLSGAKIYLEDAEEDTVNILNYSSPILEETLHACIFGEAESCRKTFLRVLTEDGYCYTFNMLGYYSLFNENINTNFDSYKRKTIAASFHPNVVQDRKYLDDDKVKGSNWTLEDGYLVEDRFTNPARAIRSDFLEIIMKIKNNEISNFCEERKNSYKLIFHLPNEIPTIFHMENFVELKTSKTISFTAKVSESDESLRKYEPDERGCYFEGERKLRFFDSYTKINCEYECLINFTVLQMDCVKPTMLRTNDMKTCPIELFEDIQAIMNHWPEIYYLTEKSLGSGTHRDFPCDCLEPCTQIKYSIVNERSFDLNSQQSNAVSLVMSNSEKHRLNITWTSIKIVFPVSQIVKTTSFVAYKIQNFISDVGGLIGLFLGFSLLSLFEITLQTSDACKKFIMNFFNKRKDKNTNLEEENDKYWAKMSDNTLNNDGNRENECTELEYENRSKQSSLISLSSVYSTSTINDERNIFNKSQGRV